MANTYAKLMIHYWIRIRLTMTKRMCLIDKMAKGNKQHWVFCKTDGPKPVLKGLHLVRFIHTPG